MNMNWLITTSIKLTKYKEQKATGNYRKKKSNKSAKRERSFKTILNCIAATLAAFRTTRAARITAIITAFSTARATIFTAFATIMHFF